jgi:methylated-DNA-[protein]-cysteine S-methyltransferase
MQKTFKYVIFNTKWGSFGLAGTEDALYHSILPGQNYEHTEFLLLNHLPDSKLDKGYFKSLQERIAAYFENACTDFPVNVNLDQFGRFGISVLNACRGITFGKIETYATLADKIGRSAAARAVGNVLAKNPLPLIIPCHRVIRSDGKMGGFSAAGGIDLKKKLLLHERRSDLLSSTKSVNSEKILI